MSLSVWYKGGHEAVTANVELVMEDLQSLTE